MKSLSISFALLCSAVFLCAQEADLFLRVFPMDNGQVSYQGVVEIEGVPAEDLYLHARKWAATYYDGFGEIRMANKEDGLIIIKSAIVRDLDWVNSVNNWYTLTMEFKEGRFRYTITDLVCEYLKVSGYVRLPIEKWLYPDKAKVRNESLYRKYAERLDNDFEYLIEDIINAMIRIDSTDTW
jgi:hypothetical protein